MNFHKIVAKISGMNTLKLNDPVNHLAYNPVVMHASRGHSCYQRMKNRAKSSFLKPKFE